MYQPGSGTEPGGCVPVSGLRRDTADDGDEKMIRRVRRLNADIFVGAFVYEDDKKRVVYFGRDEAGDRTER